MISDFYQQLLDEETIAFIQRTDSYYPPDTVTASISRQREIYNEMCRQFAAPVSTDISWGDAKCCTGTSHSVDVRCYIPSGDAAILESLQRLFVNKPIESDEASEPIENIIVYMHGGGFVVGGLESHHDVCAELSFRCGYPLVSVDYRLSPEHPHPAAIEDVLAVIHKLAIAGKKLILCGDSAGGNLAAAASAHCRDDAACSATISGQVLIYPALGGHKGEFSSTERNSYNEHAHAPMLTMEEVLFYSDIRLPETGVSSISSGELVSLEPLTASDFSGLPKTVCFGAQCDPLHDDSTSYSQRVNEAGGQARCVSEAGLVHGYLRGRHSVGRAAASFDHIVAAVIECV